MMYFQHATNSKRTPGTVIVVCRTTGTPHSRIQNSAYTVRVGINEYGVLRCRSCKQHILSSTQLHFSTAPCMWKALYLRNIAVILPDETAQHRGTTHAAIRSAPNPRFVTGSLSADGLRTLVQSTVTAVSSLQLRCEFPQPS
jgi:hypothetical protein